MPDKSNAKKYEAELKRLQKKRLLQMQQLYNNAATEAARITASIMPSTDKIFSFSQYPTVKNRIDELIKTLHEDLVGIVKSGTYEAWLLCNAKNDLFVEAVFSATRIHPDQLSRFKEPNIAAFEAFHKRKIKGLNLSDRVWRLTESLRSDLELSLDLGLGEGLSGNELAINTRRYLNEPDKLFRRVRDKHGLLKLSKAAASYHPGQGVYRSSYKNAIRMTGTEISMAYRTADHERWGQMDFVIGQQVKLSPTNHPVSDICDTLQGTYPKEFKFMGWHPQCRCYVTPLLCSQKQIEEYADMIMQDKDTKGFKFDNRVTETPHSFNRWIEDNRERLASAADRGTLPYFIKDNKRFADLM